MRATDTTHLSWPAYAGHIPLDVMARACGPPVLTCADGAEFAHPDLIKNSSITRETNWVARMRGP